MSTLNPGLPVRRDPPWWVVVLAIPLFGMTLILALLGGLSGVSLIDAISASRQVSQSIDLPPGGAVTISATSAAMTIEAGPDGQVSVVDVMSVRSPTSALAQQALDSFRRSVLSTDGGGVAVSVPTPEDFNLTAFQLNRRVTIRVPADVALKLDADSAAVDVHDLSGPLDLTVDSGAVRLKGVTVDGADHVSARAGAIDFEGSLVSGSLDVETQSGAINLLLPAGTNASYDVATTSGAIFVQPEHGTPTAAAGRGNAVTGILGDGSGAALRLRASSGAIAIRVR